MADTRSSIRSPEATAPISAEDRDIVRFGDPCLVAALRLASPTPTRHHVALAQLPFTGSDQHVSAQEPHQRVTQAKVGGSRASHDNKLNQFGDAGLLREVTFAASHACSDTGHFRLLSLSSRAGAAGDRCRFRRRSRGKSDQAARRPPDPSYRCRSGDKDQDPGRSHALASREGLISCPACGPELGIAPVQPKSSAPVFSKGAS